MAAYEVLLLNTTLPQIQAAQSGDTYVVPRDITFSTNATFTTGTANGVMYLNGDKVVSTGSLLTFNGTTFTAPSLSLTNALSTTSGGTGLSSFTAGDLTYYSTGTALSKLAIGTANQVLTSSGTAPQWTSLSSIGVTSVSFGSTGLTPSSATAGAVSVAGTLVTSNGGTGLSSYTAGDLVYYSTGTALSKLAIGTASQILTSSGSAPQWSTASGISVGTATNLAGGAAGSVPYQSGAGATTFLSIGAANRVLTSTGSAPQWVTSLTGLTGVSSSSITNTALTSGRVVYSTTGGAQTDSASLTFDGTTLTAGGFSGPLNGTVGATTANTGAFTTLSASSTVTLSGGTANGVLYLNGSKVATSGSALTFDGTNLGVGTTSATRKLTVSNSGAEGLEIGPGSANGDTAGAVTSIYYNRSGSAYVNAIQSANSFIYQLSGVEGMRLTSTGLGIGTSSVFGKLSLQNSTVRLEFGETSGANYLESLNNARTDTAGFRIYGSEFKVFTGPAGSYGDRLTVDSSGNLGIGVTPSANQGQRSLNVGNYNGTYTAVTAGASGNGYGAIGYNVGFTSTTNSYKALSADYMSWINFDSGAFKFFQTGTVAAGSTQTGTQAMTLDASGNLLVGTTSSTGISGAAFKKGAATSCLIELSGGNGTPATDSLAIGQDASNIAYVYQRANQALILGTNNTERARITSGGDLLVGTTNTAPGSGNVVGVAVSGLGYVSASRDSVAAEFNRIGSDGDNIVLRRAGTLVGSISVTTTATAYNTSSDYRLKNNPQPLTGSGAFIDAIQPKTWNWTADGSKGVGFIAHEVQEVSPGSVTGTKDAVDEEGKPIMQAMEYGSAEFIANIIAELQSLRARVAQLESKGV